MAPAILALALPAFAEQLQRELAEQEGLQQVGGDMSPSTEEGWRGRPPLARQATPLCQVSLSRLLHRLCPAEMAAAVGTPGATVVNFPAWLLCRCPGAWSH